MWGNPAFISDKLWIMIKADDLLDRLSPVLRINYPVIDFIFNKINWLALLVLRVVRGGITRDLDQFPVPVDNRIQGIEAVRRWATGGANGPARDRLRLRGSHIG